MFFIRNGKISARHLKLFEYYGDPLQTIENYIAQFYENNIIPRELFVQSELETDILDMYLNTKITKPLKSFKSLSEYVLLSVAGKVKSFACAPIDNVNPIRTLLRLACNNDNHYDVVVVSITYMVIRL